jgi:hypothetical protein
MARTKKAIGQTCIWAEDEDGAWDTACGERFEFTDGGPAENGAKFCLYCGARLLAQPVFADMKARDGEHDA